MTVEQSVVTTDWLILRANKRCIKLGPLRIGDRFKDQSRDELTNVRKIKTISDRRC